MQAPGKSNYFEEWKTDHLDKVNFETLMQYPDGNPNFRQIRKIKDASCPELRCLKFVAYETRVAEHIANYNGGYQLQTS